MLKVYPDYYKSFRCIGGTCAHNCCIGWEIDVDEDTLEKYRTLEGSLGERLRCGITWDDDQPHFIHGEDKRCPFLNKQNLCDIIATIGEEHLCVICSEHPRFTCELPGRVELGVGLCCEEAARIVIGKRDAVTLIHEGVPEAEDEIISLRDKVIACLQDRSLSISDRVRNMLNLSDAFLPDRTVPEWAEYFTSLERLDEKWTDVLTLILKGYDSADTDGFNRYMADRQHEYEQLLVYLIYRHMACGADVFDAASRAAFAALGHVLIYSAGACMWTRDGKFDFEDQIELVRLFSSEIEYSEDNLENIFDELY